MTFYNSPFNLIRDLSTIPFGQDVYVVSDSVYKELRQKQAKEEITVLQNRAEHYDKAAANLRSTILQLQKEHDLLPPAEEKSDE